MQFVSFSSFTQVCGLWFVVCGLWFVVYMLPSTTLCSNSNTSPPSPHPSQLLFPILVVSCAFSVFIFFSRFIPATFPSLGAALRSVPLLYPIIFAVPLVLAIWSSSLNSEPRTQNPEPQTQNHKPNPTSHTLNLVSGISPSWAPWSRSCCQRLSLSASASSYTSVTG